MGKCNLRTCFDYPARGDIFVELGFLNAVIRGANDTSDYSGELITNDGLCDSYYIGRSKHYILDHSLFGNAL